MNKEMPRIGLILCVILLVIVEFFSLFLMYKSSTYNVTLDDVILKEEVVESNTFAIMIEKVDGTGYEESLSTSWPTDMKFNSELSGCIDNDGNKIENSLTFDSTNSIAVVSTQNTSYCYLYFDIVLPAGETLLANPNSGLNTTLEGGLYRYQGTNDTVNNYLCFGYSDYESDCDFTNTTNSDLYAYRIIGINESGGLKLIKKEALNTTYTWNSSTGVTWPNSGAYSSLNGSTFYTNTTYVPTSWQSKIATTTWKYGDIATYNTTASAVYTTESGWTTTTSAKIGLMYMHDYYYAYQSGGLNCSSSGSYTTCKTAWLHLSVNDSGAPSAAEWTMSRRSSGVAWYVDSDGFVSYYGMTYAFSVRPVFYLTSDVQFVDGTGTSTDPFIVE